ncbi:DUF2274 domain-containing protein [Paracoccus kondratievae]|uniref:DUF2274 domain-containing protein n=2 Tax=Paracoccus TaxID=265 RepID=A0A7H9BXL2_PARPN|nr:MULTISPECIES: DUF2274 domain-containing protein [Paracoccus]QFQ88835.1 DUF2274 domain-containing protein [Paracoccus kondratievae]QLH16137.1 DUF2274 domain-containing protein [Paracoccus pantotrophus]GLK63777.1 hypothetical protein GCM10017635_12480 [Paracoccus kondratievae]
MVKLKLAPPADDKPVKVTVELPAGLHRDLVSYGRLLAAVGSPPIEPARLIAPMLERFVATDRGFAKARKAGTGGADIARPAPPTAPADG